MSRATILCIALAIVAFSSSTQSCSAREPGWEPYVVAVGAHRQRIISRQIIYRPYRPLHFYGNTVRRIHYRGMVRPTLKDLQTTTTMLVSGF